MKLLANYKIWIIASLAFVLLSSQECSKAKHLTVEPYSVSSNIETKVPIDFKFDPTSYDANWKKVDSLTKKGLYKSAFEEVKIIYSLARTDKNYPQVIKAQLHKLKFNTYLDEDDFIIAIAEMDSLTQNAEFPLKQLSHLLTAKIYYGYYNANRYTIMDRTTTQDFDNKDVRTWDLRKIAETITHHYIASVSDADALKKINIEDFKDILNYNATSMENSLKLRPTLYDFLVHESLDFFLTAEFGISENDMKFVLDNESYLSGNKIFTHLKIDKKDSLSNIYYATKLFQEITWAHSNDEDRPALIDVTLKRLDFMYNNVIVDNKDELYLKTLNELIKQNTKHESVTEIIYKKANWYFKNADKNSLDDSLKIGKKIANRLCEEAIALYPDAYGASSCKHLQGQIKQKALSLNTEGVIAPNTNQKYLVDFKNLDTVYFRLLKFPNDYKIKNYYQSEVIADLLKDGKLQKEWLLQTPNQNDFENYTFDSNLDPLDIGNYCLIAATEPTFSVASSLIQYGFMRVTNFALVETKIKDDQWDLKVLDRITGKPKSNVKVNWYESKYNKLSKNYEYKKVKTATTDSKGETSLTHSQYATLYPELIEGDDYYIDNSGLYFYEKYQNNYYPTYQTHFFLDRKIYRPGQKIMFKGIATIKDKEGSRILANTSRKVTFYDVNYQVVKEMTVKTNEYGSFSGEFIAPASGLTGQMSITDGYSTSYFRVEEYKRPKFEVNFEPIEGAFKLNSDIKVIGKSDAYAGNPIDGATVKYRVVRGANFPYWSWYRWGYMPSSKTTEIISGETITDSEGNFEVNFNAKEDKTIKHSFYPTYVYTIYADVTDINGETRSGQTMVYVGKNAMTISTNISNEINKESLNYFKVNTYNLNGQKVPAKVELEIIKLKTPDKVFRNQSLAQAEIRSFRKEVFEKLYPQDAYEDENKVQNYLEDKKVMQKIISTDENDTVFFEKKNDWTQGHYKLTLKSTDAFGEEVYEEKNFTIFDKNSRKPLGTEVLWVKELGYATEPGEQASFVIASKDNIELFYQVIKNNKIVEKKTINLNNEQKIISFPVTEDDRGGFDVQFSTIKNERNYAFNKRVYVPFSNKQLNVKLATFRDKMLPGSDEEWKVIVSGPKSEKVAAEMVVAMYDASLDAFASNNFYMYVNHSKYQSNYNNIYSQYRGFNKVQMQVFNYWYSGYSFTARNYPTLNLFGFNPYYYLRGPGYVNYYANGEVLDGMYLETATLAYDMEEDESGLIKSKGLPSTGVATEKNSPSPPPPPSESRSTVSQVEVGVSNKEDKSAEDQKPNEQGMKDLSQINARTNFSETAFFFPHLETNSKGEIIFSFKMPESLTKWKFIGLAHTKDLKSGTVSKEVVTQKDLMVVPNAPRFFREGDKLFLSSKVSNLSAEILNGNIQLFMTDALTQKSIDELVKNTNAQKTFRVDAKGSTSVEWEIYIPEGVQAITYKIVAEAGDFSDGEEMTIPVLSNRMMVTESIPLFINKKGSKTFKLENLINSGDSKTLRHEKVTLEFTSNPAWYAIQSLPYLMEYPYECAEQTFSRYYANAIAAHVANSNPKIKAVFDTWKNESKEAFLSNLEKNQELKTLFLEETPWVLQGQNESENKRRVGLLFDLNRMEKELDKTMHKLQEMQVAEGGWAWFKGMRANRYITQYILSGMGHLNRLGVINSQKHLKEWKMIKKAVDYLDREMVKDFEWLKKHNTDIYSLKYVGHTQLQYMYARSFFDFKMDKKAQEAHNYYLGQAKKYWLTNNIQTEAMLALTLERLEPEGSVQDDIMKSLAERALHSEEMGMYYKDNVSGYYWYQSPIESQAMLIEAFDEVAKNEEAVEELKVWLLKQKQTTHWKTTKATSEACYALLLRGTDILSNEEIVEVKLGDMKVVPEKTEAGTGYFKTSWNADEIKADMGNVTVSRQTTGVSWGGLYWQYFENLDKIKTHETPLTIKKKLFKVQLNKDGEFMTPIVENSDLKVGDKIRVRIEIHVDRDMEYVHLKDMRASGLEPLNVLSSYKWQDGLGYYESTKDASTNFFMDFLKKGSYVFEYDLKVFHKGDFSNGITTMQSMYAPEFSSHSEGVRVVVKE